MTKLDKAFTPIKLRSGVTLKNRLMMAPLTIYDSYENGMISDHELEYYKVRSHGAGAVITAATYVNQLGKTFESGPGANLDDQLPGLIKLANTIKSQGAKAILQIFHGGRMVNPSTIKGKTPVSASAAKALRDDSVIPRELSKEEVLETIQDFGSATKRAIDAGFDGVEIHGANTYLIQQFFSPHSNRRSDEWGGSLEKRMNFPLSVINEVKETAKKYAKGPFIIGYRISPEELEEPGITLSDTLDLIDQIINKEIDYLHISLGNIWRSSIRDKSDDRSLVKIINHHVNQKIPIVGVGSVKNKETIDQALDVVDLVAIGRQLIVDPSFVEKIEHGDLNAVRSNISYYDKELLKISDPTWQYISATPGWFPISNTELAQSNNEPWMSKR